MHSKEDSFQAIFKLQHIFKVLLLCNKSIMLIINNMILQAVYRKIQL